MEGASLVHVVLVQPEIPPNTGNIARTCAATGTILHLVGPLGFSLDDRHLKRAGLDYWPLVTVKYYPGFQEFLAENSGRFYYTTTKAARLYTNVQYHEDDFLVFGSETRGLPEEILRGHE
ncbi:MAG: tRNA (cytidine(34)-2'-O)-methyltransferase, partial [Clostridia bacterium]|nr:tRNA (cytidine(34)-2'-O)-methyltransferase [Clostridia bacterium]